MTITSLNFIWFVILALVAYHGLPARWRAPVLLPATSLGFVLLVVPGTEGTAAVLGFLVLGWLALEATVRLRRFPVQAGVLAFVLLVFGCLKGYEFLSFLLPAHRVPATVGLSYILIRLLQLLVDARENPALRPTPVTLFSFLTFWPSFTSGPIQRFDEFIQQTRELIAFRLSDAVWLAALKRIIKGYFYVLVLADVTKHLWLGLKLIAMKSPAPLALGASQGTFLVHLFFDFAGYTEIVIGVASLFGMRLPENFNSPFQARSFLDFWSRWHMSMSNWFKVYIFNPLLMKLTARWPDGRAALVHGAIAFFCTFFLVGLWHGTTSAYVTCGVLLGLGGCVNQFHRSLMRSWLGKKRFDALNAKQIYISICAAVSFTYIALSIIPLWTTMDDMQRLLAQYKGSGVLMAEACLMLAWLVILPVCRAYGAVKPGKSADWHQYLLMGAQCAVIEAYTILFPSLGGSFFYEQF